MRQKVIQKDVRMRISSLFIHNSSFVMQNSSFLMQNSSLLMQKLSFLLTELIEIELEHLARLARRAELQGCNREHHAYR